MHRSMLLESKYFIQRLRIGKASACRCGGNVGENSNRHSNNSALSITMAVASATIKRDKQDSRHCGNTKCHKCASAPALTCQDAGYDIEPSWCRDEYVDELEPSRQAPPPVACGPPILPAKSKLKVEAHSGFRFTMTIGAQPLVFRSAFILDGRGAQ